MTDQSRRGFFGAILGGLAAVVWPWGRKAIAARRPTPVWSIGTTVEYPEIRGMIRWALAETRAGRDLLDTTNIPTIDQRMKIVEQSGVLDFWDDPREDIYTLDDGEAV